MKNILLNNIKNKITNFIKKLSCVLFPISCTICSKILPSNDYTRLCDECEKTIKKNSTLFCVLCALPLEHGGMHCPTCIKIKNTPYEFIRSAGIYEGTLKKLIIGLKYQTKHYCVRALAKLLAQTYSQYFNDKCIDLLIPTPMHPLKKLFRNYNHCELLSEELSKLINIKVCNNTLVKIKHTRSQAKLKRAQRLNNLKNAFKINNSKTIEQKNILLIDDVCTTTATIHECAIILKKAGAAKVYVITVARDIKH